MRWRDLDAYNHVNNSTFLTYLEEARLVWLAGIEGEWRTDAFSPVLAASQVNFRGQIEWPGELVVEVCCEKLGNSSLTLSHRITSADGGRTLQRCQRGHGLGRPVEWTFGAVARRRSRRLHLIDAPGRRAGGRCPSAT